MWSVYEKRDRWARYGYEEQILAFNGEKTRFKAIVKDGELVTITSLNYMLIPNELVVEVADQLAPALNATRSAVIYDNWKVYILYTIPETYKMKDTEVQMGYYIVNAVDGTSALTASFMARVNWRGQVFDNLVYLRRVARVLSPTKAVAMVHVVHRESAKMSTEKVEEKTRDLVERIKTVISEGRDVVLLWRLWCEVSFDTETIKLIYENFPEVYMPAVARSIVKQGYKLTNLIPVFDLYMETCHKIWTTKTNTSPTRKIALVRRLQQLFEETAPKK
ncbi:MAG: hypothetical protein NZ957_05780 [Thaumarchaeota archaeon]|nr:hypothetical protein [Candidatus Calditenuaceae archaeon]